MTDRPEADTVKTRARRLDLRGVCPLLEVFDMPRSLAFYRDVLGFEVIASAPPGATNDAYGWAWLRHGEDVEIMLNSAYDLDDERPPQPDARRVAAHRDTCLYIGAPDIRRPSRATG